MGLTKYINARGTTVYEKPLSWFFPDERRKMLEYFVKHGRPAMRKKFGLSSQTAGHLIYYGKKTIAEIEDENFKAAGL